MTGKEPTRAMIQKFIKVRRMSGLGSNLQFQFDATEAGFHVGDLPPVKKLPEGGYEWTFTHGVLREDRSGYTYRSKD